MDISHIVGSVAVTLGCVVSLAGLKAGYDKYQQLKGADGKRLDNLETWRSEMDRDRSEFRTWIAILNERTGGHDRD